MRYKPYHRHTFEDTARKRAAFLRKQRRERDALPLFSKEIAAGQHSVDEEMDARAVASAAQEQRARSARARDWRAARAELRAMPKHLRETLDLAWRCAPYPGDPSRLHGMIRAHCDGTLDLTALPFPLSPTDGAGHRRSDIWHTDVPWQHIPILTCREIAAHPDQHSIATRRAAYQHLQKAAVLNKDKAEAMRDRARAAALFLRMGALDVRYRRLLRRK